MFPLCTCFLVVQERTLLMIMLLDLLKDVHTIHTLERLGYLMAATLLSTAAGVTLLISRLKTRSKC